MTNIEVLKWVNEIRNGSGFDRIDFLKRIELAPMMNESPKEINNGHFVLGVEYGILYAISKIFEFDNKI